MRECLTAQPQPEGIWEHETNHSVPWQEEQADTIDSNIIADYKPDLDHKPEGSDPKIEPVNEVQKEEDSDGEYVKMEITCQGTLHQRSVNCKVVGAIEHVHKAQGPEIMALWLQDMYLQLRLSPKAAKLLIREQGLNIP